MNIQTFLKSQTTKQLAFKIVGVHVVFLLIALGIFYWQFPLFQGFWLQDMLGAAGMALGMIVLFPIVIFDFIDTLFIGSSLLPLFALGAIYYLLYVVILIAKAKEKERLYLYVLAIFSIWFVASLAAGFHTLYTFYR